jgi:hypothetical protein
MLHQGETRGKFHTSHHVKAGLVHAISENCSLMAVFYYRNLLPFCVAVSPCNLSLCCPLHATFTFSCCGAVHFPSTLQCCRLPAVFICAVLSLQPLWCCHLHTSFLDAVLFSQPSSVLFMQPSSMFPLNT